MKSTNPDHKNRQNHHAQGGCAKTYTIIHVDRNAPEAICIDLLDAADEVAANRAAKRRFPNSTVLRIALRAPAHPAAAYPDARFIHGEFRADQRRDDRSWPDFND